MTDASNNRTAAVVLWYAGNVDPLLKQAALLSDVIVFRHVHCNAECEVFSKTVDGKATLQTVEYLKERGLVVEAPEIDVGSGLKRIENENSELVAHFKNERKLREFEGKSLLDNLYLAIAIGELRNKGYAKYRKSQFYGINRRYKDLYTRLLALQLQPTYSETIPVLELPPSEEAAPLKVDEAAKRILLSNIPCPLDNTPWEAIFEWRADPDAQRRLRRLRMWVNSALAKARTPREFETELMGAIDDYVEYMGVQHRRFGRGRVETVITGAVEILEDLVKFKWSKIVKMHFQLGRENIALMEAELKAPGRTVAYLAQTSSQFDKSWRWW